MKRALIAAGLLFVAGLVATPARAQTGTARGKVLDAQGQPLADAKVTIDFQGGITRKFETKTNKKGEYMQVGMQPGPYRVTATKDGYQTAAQDTRINLGDPTQVPDFKLPTLAQAAQAPGTIGWSGSSATLADRPLPLMEIRTLATYRRPIVCSLCVLPSPEWWSPFRR